MGLTRPVATVATNNASNAVGNYIDGYELITNKYFSSFTADDPDDWVVQNEDANNYYTESSGLRVVSDNSAVLACFQQVCVSGLQYQFCVNCSVATAGRVDIVNGGAVRTVVSSPGTSCVYVTASNTVYNIRNTAGAACDITITMASCRRVW